MPKRMIYSAITHHLVAPANEHGHCTCVGALLNDKHFIARSSEGDFANKAGLS